MDYLSSPQNVTIAITAFCIGILVGIIVVTVTLMIGNLPRPPRR